MNMVIKVVIKKRAPKPKTPRGITRAAFAMALLFFALCQWQNKVYFDGNHSSGVVGFVSVSVSVAPGISAPATSVLLIFISDGLSSI